MSNFLETYIKTMRPYLFFLTGIAGWLGILFTNPFASISKQVIILCILFMSYGINQVVNDFLGIKEDRVNAPHRPLVSGELDKRNALLFTILLFVLGAVITFFLNPYALIIYFAGLIFNFIYEYFKGIPLLGNIWFGIMIALAPFYGALTVSNSNLINIFQNRDILFLALFVALVCSTMAFFTYFRDYLGDKKGGKKTLIVLMKPQNARILNFVFSLLPFLTIFFIIASGFWTIRPNLVFLILFTISFIICQYTAFLYSRHFKGGETYYSLRWNFQGAILSEASFMALVSPLLSSIVFILAFIIINALFSYYKNPLG